MRGVEQIPWAYDAFCALAERRGFRRWREWLASGARGRTLEVGCGTGRNLALYPPGTEVIAVDPSQQMLLKARHRAPQVPMVRASAEALPFAEGSFETAVSALVFCSVGDVRGALAEVRRVLRRGGSLRMIEHVRSASPRGAWLQDFLQPAWTWLAGGCHPNRDTERSVEEAGFAIDAEGRRAKGTMRRFSACVKKGAPGRVPERIPSPTSPLP